MQIATVRWLPDRYSTAKLPELPVGVYPTHTARRISTQRSYFTVHGSDADGLEQLAGDSDAHIAKVLIPRTAVSKIKEELVVSGITCSRGGMQAQPNCKEPGEHSVTISGFLQDGQIISSVSR
jgi:hypothetical protein